MNPDRPTDPDDFQQAWQMHASQSRITINTDLLLKEVRRHQEAFRATISWRDFTEVGLAILMIPLWFYMGIALSLPWTWYLGVPVLFWWIGFMLFYRTRHKQQPDQADETLLQCVKRSLTDQEDQIWLLRNVLWWYLLPPTIAILAFFAQVFFGIETPMIDSGGWTDTLARAGMFLLMSLFILALYYFVYAMNQHAVRSQLEPRRRELLSLLASLKDDSASEVSVEYPIFASAEPVKFSPRRMIIGLLCAVLILLIGVPSILYLGYKIDQATDPEHEPHYPVRSPFAAVRWQDSQPEVSVNEEWFKLISLNDIPASEIVDFSQENYGDLWQKRFEEDLVEVLTRMGHPPHEYDYNVTLVVESLTNGETQTLEDIPMTSANRQAIKDAAEARASMEL